jgi:hypothetical protein
MDINEREKFYKNIVRIKCPYLGNFVYFKDLGLEHLHFKNKYTLRTLKDRDVRMKLLPICIKILELSYTLQGISFKNRFEKRFINNRKETALMRVTYYEFIAVIENKKVKVIVKKLEDHDNEFLSIIPLFKEKTPPYEGDGFS